VRARDGARIWSKRAAGGLLRGGNFYATAAVAYGRVYIGATDGRAYSLSAKDGRIAWAHQTGRYVYSSAAVKNVEGRGPMVFFGSYDGTFYALDARSGKVRWTHRSGGKISGSPTIVGNVVYYADLGRAITVGLRVGSGEVAFKYPIGAYDPIVSDGVNLYLTGNRSLTALEPRRLYKKREKAKQAKVKKKKARARALVSPAWPEQCRQLAPCGPLVAVRDRRIRMRG
jgi:outer membrane protein assembly factor BamB